MIKERIRMQMKSGRGREGEKERGREGEQEGGRKKGREGRRERHSERQSHSHQLILQQLPNVVKVHGNKIITFCGQ